LFSKSFKNLKAALFLGAVHKRPPQLRKEGVCPVRTFFGREVLGLQLWTSTLFGAKTSDFPKFVVCPHGQEGIFGQFKEKRGQFFAILCGRYLWMAP